MTNTIVAWLPVFSRPEFAAIVLESWRFLQRERDIDIVAYVIMENHLHWIGVGPHLSKRVGEFKSYTATTIIKRMEEKHYKTLLQELEYFKLRHKVDQTHQMWQEGSHPQMIDSDDMLWQKIEYIHNLDSDDMLWQKIEYIHNHPLRRGYVDDLTHWRYASARSYAGQAGLIDVCVDWQ